MTSYLYSSGVTANVNTNAIAAGEETVDRDLAVGTVVMTSGVLRLRFFTARKTETITQVRLVTAGTAAGATPTLVRMGVWTVSATDDLTALVASTPNDTALLAGAFTPYTKALSASFPKAAGTRYAFGLLVVTAAAAPNIVAAAGATSFANLVPRLMGQPSGQADLPATLPAATIAAGGSPTGGPFAVLLP